MVGIVETLFQRSNCEFAHFEVSEPGSDIVGVVCVRCLVEGKFPSVARRRVSKRPCSAVIKRAELNCK